MSLILERIRKNERHTIKNLGNLKRNFKNPQDKTNLYSKSIYTKSPHQKSFVIKNKKNLKSNDISYTKNIANDIDDMNYLLSSENDPFSRSVIYSNNKKIENNLFPSLKSKAINDASNKKNPKIMNNKNHSLGKRKVGMTHSVKNSNIKKKNNYNLNKSGDFSGISKFDEKFQLIEDKIIDKNYENDIDHDEMIIGTNKKNINANSLFNKIQINNKNDDDELFLYFNKNKKDNEEDYSINNNFENNKADFSIMYIDNYEKMINDDVLLLEIQLLFEKILDLQNSYHEEYYKIINQINNKKTFLSLLIYKYKEIQKKNFNLLKIKEINNYKNKLNTFIDIQEKEHKSNFTEINNKEINLWKNMLGNKFIKNKNYIDEKKEIKDLFKKIVFNKYSYLKNSLNDVENKIVVNLMKKHNYKVLTDKKIRNHRIDGTYNGNHNYYNNIKKKKENLKKGKMNNHKIINSSDIFESKRNNTKNNNYNITNNFLNSSKKKGY